MIRLGIVADNHFDETSRFDEAVEIHRWIAEDGRARGVHAWLLAGDLFERKSTIRERLAAARALLAFAEQGPVVIVRGNHDVPGDLEIFGKLHGRHPIIVEEGAAVHTLVVDVADETARGGARQEVVHVGCLSWPRKAEMRAMLERLRGAPLSAEDGDRAGAELLRDVLRGLGSEMIERGERHAHYEGCPRVLLAHAMVTGSKTSTGQPLVGCDFELGLEDLALAGADFVAIGHIHKGQDWEWGGVPIVYPGSPRRTAFGELETKGYLVVELDGSEDRALRGWQRIETPCAAMVLATGAWDGSTLSCSEELDQVAGAEIRFRYTVDSDQREAARGAAKQWRDQLLERGAKVVKVEEEVRVTTRARAPEMATAVTTWDQLQALWRAKRLEVDAEREARLRAKLEELEAA